jgi:lysophospholipase
VAALCSLLTLLVAGCEQPVGEPTPARIPPGLATRYFPPPGWTWSYLPAADGPPIRYGVGTPPRAVRGAVLILPGFGEPAEVWFETARELIDNNYAVWLLDLAGQGGSGRWADPPDKAHLPSMEPNLTALRTAITEVVRPTGAPLVMMGSGLGAQVALRAAGEGLPGVEAVILSAPALSPWRGPTPGPLAQGLSLIGFSRTYATGQGDWKSADSRASYPGTRAAVPQAWMRANPELRTGGVTWGWIKAYSDSASAARSTQTLERVALPVMMLDGGDGAGRDACQRMPKCRYIRLPSGPTPHLAPDATREVWRKAMTGFLAQQGDGYSVAAAPVRTAR